MKRWKTRGGALLGVMMILCTGVSAFAAEAEPLFTPEMTVQQLHDDPVLNEAGIMTYFRDKNLYGRWKWKDKTFAEYMGENVTQSCIESMEQIVRNHNAGVQVVHKIYTEEEIALDPGKNSAELWYFPAENTGEKTKYAVLMSGNVLDETQEIKEGAAGAYKLNQLGYAAFVLRYRTWMEMDDDAPMYDLGRAIRYITEHAEEFNVLVEDYALIGHSSGGHIVGLFGGERLGYKHFGVEKPSALILAYPVNTFAEGIPVYHLVIDRGMWGTRYYDKSVSGSVTEDFPPTYFWYGKDDTMLMALCWPLQGPALGKALERMGVEYREVVFRNAPHGCALGEGTDADGWLYDAVAFWEEQSTTECL